MSIPKTQEIIDEVIQVLRRTDIKAEAVAFEAQTAGSPETFRLQATFGNDGFLLITLMKEKI